MIHPLIYLCMHACILLCTYIVKCIYLSKFIRFDVANLVQGVSIPCPPPPQPKLTVAQYNQTYCRKVKSISAIDFHYFYFVSIFTTFFILSNKNAQIHKNRTQSMLFNCLFLTLYGCYRILLYWN